jgi:integrase
MNQDRFIKWCKSEGIRPKTLDKYLWCLNKIPDDILNDSNALKDWLDNCGFEPTTKYTLVASIRTYYRFLKKPKQEIELFNFPDLKDKKTYDWLLEKQIKDLYENCVNNLERIIVKLLLETGIRKSVLLEFIPNDIDWDKGLIKIRADYVGNKGKVEYARPISIELQEMLKNYINKNNIKDDKKIIQFYYGRNKIPYANQGWVLWRVIKNIGSRCKIGWLYPHALRHTFASFYNKNRKDPFALADAMGDKQVQSVKIYVHTLEDEKKVHEEITKDMFGR